jgi:hypothetical protein
MLKKLLGLVLIAGLVIGIAGCGSSKGGGGNNGGSQRINLPQIPNVFAAHPIAMLESLNGKVYAATTDQFGYFAKAAVNYNGEKNNNGINTNATWVACESQWVFLKGETSIASGTMTMFNFVQPVVNIINTDTSYNDPQGRGYTIHQTGISGTSNAVIDYNFYMSVPTTSHLSDNWLLVYKITVNDQIKYIYLRYKKELDGTQHIWYKYLYTNGQFGLDPSAMVVESFIYTNGIQEVKIAVINAQSLLFVALINMSDPYKTYGELTGDESPLLGYFNYVDGFKQGFTPTDEDNYPSKNVHQPDSSFWSSELWPKDPFVEVQ